MKAIVKGAAIGGAGALLLGASLALSSATVVSGANRIQPEPTAKLPSTLKCSKSAPAYCLTVQNTSTGGAIKGNASSGVGVYGFSKSTWGVYGVTHGNTGGVYGASSSADGVVGSTTGSDRNGVEGESGSGNGVYGESGTGYGVSGYSTNGGGAYFENDGAYYYALYAKADNPASYLMGLLNSNTGGYFTVDYDGNGYFSGSVSASGFTTDIRTRDGARAGAFNSESTRATIEDTGTARLESGEGAVRFDSAFASTIDAARGYQVFLTPNGETRGWLYVAAKYEGGFIVREAEHGRSSVYFDYRVVAHQYGASDARLPQLNLKPPPTPHLPQHVQPQQPPRP
jgi:hypothetical protein